MPSLPESNAGLRMPYTTKAGLTAWLKWAMEEGELKKTKAPVR
jgi:hypothetical protein